MAMETDTQNWDKTQNQMLEMQPKETWLANSGLNPNSIPGYQIPKFVCELAATGLQAEQVKASENVVDTNNRLVPGQMQTQEQIAEIGSQFENIVNSQLEQVQASNQRMVANSREVGPTNQSFGSSVDEVELRIEMNKLLSTDKRSEMQQNPPWIQNIDKNGHTQEDSEDDCTIIEPEPNKKLTIDVEKDNELQESQDHQDLTCNLPQSSATRELVIAAISVMKSRKARPDTKRLCNWVSRKYSRTVNDVVAQIDSLCEEGILAKVEYKGSISFRIVSDKKMHKRAGRRKNSELTQGPAGGNVVKPKKIPKAKREMPRKSSPLTISMLVREHFIEKGVEKRENIDKSEIIEAIQISKRSINKKGVMRELEALLAQENHLGYLIKGSNDQYSLPEINLEKALKGTITIKDTKQRQKTMQKKMEMEAEMLFEKVKKEREEESRIEAVKTEDEKKDDLIKDILISHKVTQLKTKMRVTHVKHKSHNLPTLKTKGKSKPNPQEEKSKLAKNYNLETLEHRRRKRVDWSVTDIKDKKKTEENILEKVPEEKTEDTPVQKEIEPKTPEQKMDEKAQDAIKSALIAESTAKTRKSKIKKKSTNTKVEKKIPANDNAQKQKKDIKKPVPGCSTNTAPKRDNSRLRDVRIKNVPECSPDEVPMPDVIPFRVASGRKKRARQIFDPADHDIPGRILKRMRSSMSPVESPNLPEVKVEAKETVHAETKKPVNKTKVKEPVCIQCDLGAKPKYEKLEKLLFCKDCPVVVHPACLNYPDHLSDRVHLQAWQCKGCKTCAMCLQPAEQGSMLYCNSCDLGYHPACHVPSISVVPEARWECTPCAAESGFTSQSTLPDPEAAPKDLSSIFLPLLPPQPPGVLSCFPGRGFPLPHFPSPEVIPANWENVPVDPNIPDISGWSSGQVYKYLVHKGVSDHTANLFIEQDIDGNSVKAIDRSYLLHCLKEVGVKLGPAIKLYQQIRKLQTRRHL